MASTKKGGLWKYGVSPNPTSWVQLSHILKDIRLHSDIKKPNLHGKVDEDKKLIKKWRS